MILSEFLKFCVLKNLIKDRKQQIVKDIANDNNYYLRNKITDIIIFPLAYRLLLNFKRCHLKEMLRFINKQYTGSQAAAIFIRC
ncbi:hypothetical protein NMYAN_50074 [Nitrosomonas nitrosa]|uniref:Uncharacterized protein n=1 Tax=Nitrosomonas nitrosa TaxID=52442 RepID=A0A8H8Z3J5_9PROT|nr:hypothetical protein NMYAN_50074 [Nitrosomonas nitrosa]